MYFKVLLFALFLVAVTADQTVEEKWTKFKTDFGKSYATPEEEAKRFEIFKKNVKFVEEHNKSDASYKVAINDFSDLTEEEFKSHHTGLKID